MIQIEIHPNPSGVTKYYAGTFTQPQLWEDEYDEETFPIREYPFTLITAKTPEIPTFERVISVQWLEDIPPNRSKIEETISDHFYDRD